MLDAKAATGIDLASLIGNPAKMQATLEDLPVLTNLIWITVKSQAPEGMDEGGFFERLDGPTLDDAGTAFVEGLVSFFKSPAMSRVIATAKKNFAKMKAAAEATMEKAADQVEKTGLDFALSSPESPASIPSD